MAWIDNYLVSSTIVTKTGNRPSDIGTAITVPASAKNTILVVTFGGGATDTNPTDLYRCYWNGTAFTPHWESGFGYNGRGKHQFHYLLAPEVGTYTITFSYDVAKNLDSCYCAFLLKNMKQTAPGTYDTTNSTGSTSSNNPAVVSNNDLVFYLVATKVNSADKTVGAGQTEICDFWYTNVIGSSNNTSWKRVASAPTAENVTNSRTSSTEYRSGACSFQTYKIANTTFWMWFDKNKKLLEDLKLGLVPKDRMRQRLEGAMQI